MTIGEDVYSELSGDAGLTALVGTRIYPQWLPQDTTLPAVTFAQVSENPQNTIGGELALKNHQYQFDVFASSYSSAQAVAAALNTAVAGASAFEAYRLTQQDLYEPQTEVHRVSVDFSIWQ